MFVKRAAQRSLAIRPLIGRIRWTCRMPLPAPRLLAVPCELIADLRMWPADSPTELAQPRVADPEVMTHLVNDRPPNLLDDLRIAVAHRADGTPVGRDPVRQAPA